MTLTKKKIEKIRRLAANGTGGEAANARRILTRHQQQESRHSCDATTIQQYDQHLQGHTRCGVPIFSTECLQLRH